MVYDVNITLKWDHQAKLHKLLSAFSLFHLFTKMQCEMLGEMLTIWFVTLWQNRMWPKYKAFGTAI